MMDRLEKAEKALSELMAVVREMRQEKHGVDQGRCNLLSAGQAYGCMMTDHNINGFVPGDWAICDAPHEKDLLWGAPKGSHVGKPIRLHTIYRSIASTEDGLVWRTNWLRKVAAPVQSTETAPDRDLLFASAGMCHTVCIMPKGNPKGIPFSVALEYMRAGREVRRPHWFNAARWRIINSCIRQIYWDGLDNGIAPVHHDSLLATDWEVVPETPSATNEKQQP